MDLKGASTKSLVMTLLALAAGALFSWIAYSPALDGEFLFDDVPLLVNHECWRGVEYIPNMSPLAENKNACNYRPGRYVTFAIDYTMAGVNASTDSDWQQVVASRMHRSSVVYHLITYVLVFLLLARFTRVPIALALATLWALHPVHTDVVAYISGRRDGVSTLLYVGAVLLLFWPWKAGDLFRDADAEAPKPPSGGQQLKRLALDALGLLLAAASFFTKEMAVTLPAVLVLLFIAKLGLRTSFDLLRKYWVVPVFTLGLWIVTLSIGINRKFAVTGIIPAVFTVGILVVAVALSQREQWKALFTQHRAKLFHMLFFALVSVVALKFIEYRAFVAPQSSKVSDGVTQWWGGSIGANFATSASLIPRYFELILWPARLFGDYAPTTLPIQESFFAGLPIGGLAITFTLLALAFVAWRRSERRVALGIGWFFVTMLPVMHIIPHHEIFAEHYLYLPMIGLVIALIPAAEWLVARGKQGKSVAVVLAVLVSVLWAGRTFARSQEFSDETTFYEVAYEYAPYNNRVLYTLAVNYVEQASREERPELYDRAQPLLERLMETEPPESVKGREGIRALTVIALAQENYDEAMRLLDWLLEVDPTNYHGLDWRSNLNRRNRNYEAAAVDLRALVEMVHERSPGSSAMRRYLGQLISALNEADQPEQVLQVADLYGIPNPEGCRLIAHSILAIEPNALARAASTIRACAENFNRDPSLVEALFLLLASQREAEQMIEVYDEYGAPTVRSCASAVNAMGNTGQTQRGLELAASCVEEFGETVELVALRAGLYLQSGQEAQARQDLERLREMDAPERLTQPIEDRLTPPRQRLRTPREMFQSSPN
ncbi:MAG: tetratricopeptide repeat protein [Myxococcales bacterium]|nr:tetratricopeptide repeat protein [Myxococcales bacterium]